MILLTQSTTIGMLWYCQIVTHNFRQQLSESLFVSLVSVVSVASLVGNTMFCSSKYLEKALKKATPFCLFEGALLHYFEGSISLWFVVYNVVVAKVGCFLNL